MPLILRVLCAVLAVAVVNGAPASRGDRQRNGRRYNARQTEPTTTLTATVYPPFTRCYGQTCDLRVEYCDKVSKSNLLVGISQLEKTSSTPEPHL